MKHVFVFGVFTKGKLVFLFNKITCTHAQAAIIVGILDLAKHALKPGHYFACDYAKNLGL